MNNVRNVNNFLLLALRKFVRNVDNFPLLALRKFVGNVDNFLLLALRKIVKNVDNFLLLSLRKIVRNVDNFLLLALREVQNCLLLYFTDTYTAKALLVLELRHSVNDSIQRHNFVFNRCETSSL